MGLFDRFRKNTVKDPFGGDGDDDFYDEESRLTGQGPKIALAASGVTFAAVFGFIGYILLTGDAEIPPPVAGTFADLEIVEEEDAPAADSTTPAGVDPTAATDRSAERRPWLTAQGPAPTDTPRPGLDAKPAAAPPAAKPAMTPPTTTAAVTPPAAPKPAAPPVAAPTAAAKAKPAPAAQVAPPTQAPTQAAKTAPAVPPTATAKPAAAAPPAALAAAPEPAPQTSDGVPVEIAGIPALNAPGAAPGAPERINTVGDAGPAVAGGRPRLVDPPLPPTDRVAVSAPPPRFAALREQKKDALSAPAGNAPKIAVVVGGLGLSQAATEAAITKLPAGVTLAFSPYARNLKTWVDRAKAQGHEVLIELPMESKLFPAEDPGPLGLLTTADLKDNTERLDAILKASDGAIGVFDTMGSKFRESEPSIGPVFAKLKEQNLFYVQGAPGARMGQATVPTAVADVIADERPFRAAIDARFDYAERLARYQGSAVISLQAKPVSFERLVLWLEQAQKKGVALAPISTVLIK